MRGNPFVWAAMVAAMLPAAALADDPRDPAMRSAAARARDSDTTRQLNLQERAMVRERDARQMRDMRAYRDGDADSYEVAANDYAVRSRDFSARRQDHQRALSDYERDRAQYERDMADWHRAVAACRAGDYAACGN